MSPAGSAGIGTLSGNFQFANPPFGAVFTYNVRQDLPADAKLVLTIENQAGQQVRRCELDKTAGLRRVSWGLVPDAPVTPAGRGAGGAGRAGGGADSIATSLAPTMQPCVVPAGRGGFGGGGGRGGGGQRVPNGSYTATIGKMVGTTVTAVGPSQSFLVLPLPQ